MATIKSFTVALDVRKFNRGNHAFMLTSQRASAPAPLAIGNIGTGNISTLATFSTPPKTFPRATLRRYPRCAKLPAEPLDGLLSSRTVLPTRSGSPVRKDRGLSIFRNKDEDGRLLILAKKQRPNHRGICIIALPD